MTPLNFGVVAITHPELLFYPIHYVNFTYLPNWSFC